MSIIHRVKKLYRQQGVIYVIRGGFSVFKRRMNNPKQFRDEVIFRIGIKQRPDFDSIDLPCNLYLGCGMTYREGFVGVDINPPPYAIKHDITEPFPLPDESVELILTEETLEHINKKNIVPVLDECYRLLQPGGLMRVGVPDYGSPAKQKKLELGYDPEWPDHSTLPTYTLFKQLFEKSKFVEFDFKHYWKDGIFHYKPLDYSKGYIKRAVDNKDNIDQKAMMKSSLIIDAVKK